MTKIVKKILLDSRITAGQKRRLEKLSERSDEEIDTSDIPELTEKFWQNAVRNPFYRPVKQQLTLRLDADIIAWLRSQGKGYQTRANALLRTAMLRDFSPKQRNPLAQTHQAHREESRRTKIGRARQVS
ncbi:MAG TPA: BrnA antitoxin family protein [Candidatus Acidoferrales bacterium]|nr:BrnA antitoxin family protein [Candidatus Acidoferrales bacterium]